MLFKTVVFYFRIIRVYIAMQVPTELVVSVACSTCSKCQPAHIVLARGLQHTEKKRNRPRQQIQLPVVLDCFLLRRSSSTPCSHFFFTAAKPRSVACTKQKRGGSTRTRQNTGNRRTLYNRGHSLQVLFVANNGGYATGVTCLARASGCPTCSLHS